MSKFRLYMKKTLISISVYYFPGTSSQSMFLTHNISIPWKPFKKASSQALPRLTESEALG